MATTSRAVSAPGPGEPLAAPLPDASPRTCRDWLLHAAPSAPSETEIPVARISATGAMPEPSFRFDPGQCSTLTRAPPCRRCSSSSTHTQWARHTCGDAGRLRRGTRCCRARSAAAPARSRRGSRRRACAPASRARVTALRRPRAVRASTTQRIAARRPREPAIGPAVPAARERHAFVDRGLRLLEQPTRHRGVRVHHALADDRAQADRLERLEDRVGIVHRLHRQDGGRAAVQQFGSRQRAAAASDVGVCAASIGQMRVRSHSSSARSSA